MNRILCGIFTVTACFLLGGKLSTALTCNKCPVGIFGRCLIPATMECSSSQPNCYTGEAKFPGVLGFLGLTTQGCIESSSCNATTNSTILSAPYTVTINCCSTDNCNPASSSAGSVQLSLTAAASAALVASLWGSWQY